MQPILPIRMSMAFRLSYNILHQLIEKSIHACRSEYCGKANKALRYRTFVEAAEENKGKRIQELVPVAEFIKVSEIVASRYLPPEQQPPFTDPEPNPGLLRKLERTGKLLEKDNLNKEKQQDFK